MSYRHPEKQWTDSTYKRESLEREIAAIKDPALRSNLQFSLSKLLMFIDDDVDRMIRKAWREGAPDESDTAPATHPPTPATFA